MSKREVPGQKNFFDEREERERLIRVVEVSDGGVVTVQCKEGGIPHEATYVLDNKGELKKVGGWLTPAEFEDAKEIVPAVIRDLSN